MITCYSQCTLGYSEHRQTILTYAPEYNVSFVFCESRWGYIFVKNVQKSILSGSFLQFLIVI